MLTCNYNLYNSNATLSYHDREKIKATFSKTASQDSPLFPFLPIWILQS